jgi:predicted patatin/cPLA2 family phospholipase
MGKTGLVLEGGGLRAVYNAGTLDRFHELGIDFDYVIGSSAGAANAASFISGQKGRNMRIIVNYLTSKKFYSLTNIFKGKPHLDLYYLYNDITYVLDPLDLEALKQSPTEFEITSTDINTGKTVYFSKKNKKFVKAMEASCALPLLGQKPVVLKGRELLDGGLSDPIPVERAAKKGCDRIVVVLTRNKGYKKKKGLFTYFLKWKYSKYKKFTKLIMNRHKRYNRTREYIKNPPADVKIFPIYPSGKLTVERLSRDKEALKKQWKMGYKDAKKVEKKLLRFLGRR